MRQEGLTLGCGIYYACAPCWASDITVPVIAVGIAQRRPVQMVRHRNKSDPEKANDMKGPACSSYRCGHAHAECFASTG